MNQKQNGFNILAGVLWLTLGVMRIIACVDSWKAVKQISRYSDGWTKANIYGIAIIGLWWLWPW